MKNYLKIMLSAIMLMMATHGYGIVEYEDWTSTNTTSGSSSSHEWTINMNQGEILMFYYSVAGSSDRLSVINQQTSGDNTMVNKYSGGIYYFYASKDTILNVNATFTCSSNYFSGTRQGRVYNIRVYGPGDTLSYNTVTTLKGDFVSLGDMFETVTGLSYYDATWSSEDESIAVVGKYGKVLGLATGTTHIIATTSKGVGVSFPIKVTYAGLALSGEKRVGDFFSIESLSSADVSIVGVAKKSVYGGSYRYYSRYLDDSNDSWSSHNSYSYDLIEQGYIYGLSAGSTTLTAKYGGKDVSVPVTVGKPYSWSTYHEYSEVSSFLLEGLPRVFEAFTGKKAVSWVSADENKVLMIDSLVIGHASDVETTTNLTATSEDGQSISFPVTVRYTTPHEKYYMEHTIEDYPIYEGTYQWDRISYTTCNPDYEYYGEYDFQEFYVDALRGYHKQDPYDSYEYWYGLTDYKICRFTISESKELSLSCILQQGSLGESKIRIWVDGIEIDCVPSSTTFTTYKDETKGTVICKHEYKTILAAGQHTLRIQASAVDGFVGVDDISVNSIGCNRIPDYDTLAEGLVVDNIVVTRAGTLGGEALKIHDNFTDFQGLCVSGPFDDYDWKVIREMTNLQVLDLTGVVADAYPTGSQNDKVKAVKLSNYITTINNTPFRNAQCTYVPDGVTKISGLSNYNLKGCRGVSEIKNGVFQGRSLPVGLEFPSLEIVEERTFHGTKFPDSRFALPAAREIGEGAFANTSLLEIDLPKAEHIATLAFDGAYLTEVNFPEVVTVDSLAFRNCPVKSVKLPKVKTVGKYAFSHYSHNTTYTYYYQTDWWGGGWWSSSEQEDEETSMNGKVEEIDMELVERLEDYAFYGHPRLTTVKSPNLKIVGDFAFTGCTNLAEIDLNQADSIGDYAFSRKYSNNEERSYYYDEYGNYCDKESSNALKQVDLSKATYVGCSAFNYSLSLESVNLSSLITMGDYAFCNCRALTTANMPSLTSMGNYTFYNCDKLNSVDMPNLTSMGNYAFYNCDYLNSVDMPSLTTMSYNAFSDCSKLNSIDLPNLTQMGSSAFYGCNSLTMANVPNLTVVPSYAFRNCGKLTSADTRRATTIGSSAFYGCSRLSTVNLSKAEKIESDAFNGCILSEINLPNVTSLGSRAFYNNTAATSIDLSDKLTAIGDESFYGCTAVEHLTLPASLTKLPSYCFSGSNNIKTISVNAPAPPSVGETPFTMQTLYTATLRVPSASMALYKGHDYWKHFYYWDEMESQLTDLVLASNIDLGTVRMDKVHVTINPGISLTMGGSEAQAFRSVLLKSTGSQTGMLLSDCERITSDQTSVELSMTGLKWYFISLPFDVTISDIQNSTGAQLAIHRYDGATRASQGTGSSWVRQRTGTLSRGKGYIIQASKATTLTLPATYETKDVPFLPYDVTFTLEENASETAANQGWNFVGNPYPTYFDIAQLGYSAPITVWTGSTYAAYSPEDDDLALAPLQPFFVQRPSGVESLTLNAQGRQTTSVISHSTEVKTMQPKANRRQLLDVVLTDGEQTDRTRVVCNALATDGYDLSCDAAKMMSMEADVPQLYTHRNGVEYAINEGPQEGGEVELGLLLPKTGTYTLRLQRADMRAMLTDLLTGETFELTADGYTFEAEAGTCDDRFVLTLLTDEETAVEDIEGEMVNGKWSNGEWYDLSGRRLNKASRGVNIVRQGTNVTKQLSR